MEDLEADHQSKNPSDDAIREQLARILGAPHFSRALKIADFLTFVVEESLAGRADRIKAQTVAQAVYQRGSDFEPQSDPLVRVEAGRLRRRLGEYYAEAGVNDPILIEIPKGGYVPSFRALSCPSPVPSPTNGTAEPDRASALAFAPKHLAVAGVAGLAAGVLATWLFLGEGARTVHIAPRFTESSEAYAMFLETRSLGRPPHIKARVVAALELARAAQALDPGFGGGYAAEAYQLWQYVMFGHSSDPEEDLKTAKELAERAINTDPEFGWGYQALSRVLSLQSDIDGAVSAAQHAAELSPANAEQWGNLGLTLALVDRSAEAIEALERAQILSQGNVRTPYLNYLGIAQFHNRQFAEAAKTIQHNRDIGGPSGPHMFAYLAAAHNMAGADGHARSAAELLRSDKSEFKVGPFLRNLVVDAEEEAFLFSTLKKVGLSAEDLKLK